MLSQVIASCFHHAIKEEQETQGQTVLERDFATIPLPDIDVPFHSWTGVLPSHACEHLSLSIMSHDLTLFIDLSKKINPTHLNPDMVIGWYIPNLIAYDQTQSPRLEKVLKKWDEELGSALATDFSGSLGSTSLVSLVEKCLVVSPHPLFVHIPVRLGDLTPL